MIFTSFVADFSNRERCILWVHLGAFIWRSWCSAAKTSQLQSVHTTVWLLVVYLQCLEVTKLL